MKLTYKNDLFYAVCSFDERGIPKDAGFKWNPLRKVWFTDTVSKAARLRQYADNDAEIEFSRLLIKELRFDGSILYPPHLKPYDFQIEKAVPWALSRSKSYLALDAGLGKTICAAMIYNTLDSVERCTLVYVCPPFLMKNVEIELNTWSMRKLKIARVRDGARDPDVLLVPDSLITKREVKDEILKSAKKNSILIIDEAHRFKNYQAKRTKALFAYEKFFKRVVFLSGTPMPNRPLELWPVLSHSAPETIDFRNFPQYGIYYCAGFENAYGWDFSGCSNLKELMEKVKSKFMLRIEKKDVLKELPPKTESLVFLDAEMSSRLEKLEKRILQDHIPEKLSDVIGDEHLSTYRKDLGLEKAPFAAQFIDEILEDSTESVLVFAIHKDAVKRLTEELEKWNPLVITGDVEKDERFRRAQEFRENPDRRVMILNIQAGGVGFNLTKASRVVFAEFSWVPSDNSQASDRAHRIGQTKNVLVNYIVFENSLDALVLNTVMKKQQITKHV